MRDDVRCVLISDVHFNINTLALASAGLQAALDKATELSVPLVVAGDLNDTKSIMRAECVNAILSILRGKGDTRVIVMVGNHDLINERSADHSLHFLDDLVEVVQHPVYDTATGLYLVPYYSDSAALETHLNTIPRGATVIMHQGVMGAFMGEYVVDKTSLPTVCFADLRVISGHYHRAQDIKCGRPRKGAVGLFSYIGTPYSVTFAEANDGPKGIQLLLTNGLLEQVPLGLRKHVIVEARVEDVTHPLWAIASSGSSENPTTGWGIEKNTQDLVWLKVSGPASELDKLSKKELGLRLLGHESYKLDLIYDESEKTEAAAIEKLPDDQILDKLIDDSEETDTQKKFLKGLWREALS